MCFVVLKTGRGAVNRIRQQVRYCVLSSIKRRIQNSVLVCTVLLHVGMHAARTREYAMMAAMNAASYPGRLTKSVAMDAMGMERVAKNHGPWRLNSGNGSKGFAIVSIFLSLVKLCFCLFFCVSIKWLFVVD